MKNVSEISGHLYEVLSSIKNVLKEMLEIEDFKYESIRDMNFNLLTQLNEKEEELVGRINLLEVQRYDIIESLSLLIGFEPSLTITQFVNKMPESYIEPVKNICWEIRNICDRISLATERNHYVLSTNAEIFDQILNLVTEDNFVRDQYNFLGNSHQVSPISKLSVLDQIV